MTKSILSILSHVSHGYVGNRAIVFPLQFCGWDVDAVNTTNLSNHPGYGKFSGSPFSAEDIELVIKGLKDIIDFNTEYEVILTGYMPNKDIMLAIFEQIKDVFKSSLRPVWILDPVMGDNGKLYVLDSVVPIYKQFFSSGFITLATPNQFEFELLSGVKITDWTTLKEAVDSFSKMYKVPYLALSSVIIDNRMFGVGYSANTQRKIFCIPIDQIDCSFSGCGDLFTALITHGFCENGQVLTPAVLGNVLLKLNRILKISLDDEIKKCGNKFVKSVKDIRVVLLRDVLLEDYTDEIKEVEYI